LPLDWVLLVFCGGVAVGFGLLVVAAWRVLWQVTVWKRRLYPVASAVSFWVVRFSPAVRSA
jgi:cytochrome b561